MLKGGVVVVFGPVYDRLECLIDVCSFVHSGSLTSCGGSARSGFAQQPTGSAQASPSSLGPSSGAPDRFDDIDGLFHHEVRIAGRLYPSSKRCSRCGYVKHRMSLSERVFRCPKCGVVIDRDMNAAKNLLWLATDSPTQSSWGSNACGEGRLQGLGPVPLAEAGTGL
jgi:predicted RNA-binding Zn-ribbon protein involved in translation (DUF1610 family)